MVTDNREQWKIKEIGGNKGQNRLLSPVVQIRISSNDRTALFEDPREDLQ